MNKSETNTVNFFGPCAPRTRMRSMSPVRLGPVMKRNHARIIPGVFLLQQFKRGGQVGQQLFAPREDDVMRRQHGQRASARAAVRHQHAAGLRDERVAFGDADVAGFKFVNVVIFVRETNGQVKRVGQSSLSIRRDDSRRVSNFLRRKFCRSAAFNSSRLAAIENPPSTRRRFSGTTRVVRQNFRRLSAAIAARR